MDVQCERCKTEYEFDDALVSGRGTTVRCTNCGHQFKVRRADPSGAEEQERWVVRSTQGLQHTFHSLRELQRAILAKQVSRSDTLTRGAAPPRMLATIAELEPFFEGRGSTRPPPGPASGSLGPVVPAAPTPREFSEGSGAAPPPSRTPAYGAQTGTTQRFGATTPLPPPMAPPRRESRPPVDPRTALGEPLPPPRKRSDTLRPAAAVPPPAAETRVPTAPTSVPPPALRDVGPPRAVHVTTDFGAPEDPRVGLPPMGALEPVPPTPAPPSGAVAAPADPGSGVIPSPILAAATPPPAPYGAASRGPFELSSPLPPPTDPVRRAAASSIEDDRMEAAMRMPLAASTEPDDDRPRHGRSRRVGGWIVAAVVVLGVGVVGWTVLRPQLQGAHGAPSAQPLDPRAAQFLEVGDRALADGNLDAAKENFDKASALAEKDPRVQLAVARLAAVRADQPWLELRLLPSDAADQQKAARSRLEDLSARAKRAADDALAGAPDEPSAVRAKIDALRIAGERDGARGYVQKIIGSATQPETAYVLAALDLAEPDPVWATVIERLRLAASAEGNAGRARGALVYALARAGHKPEARAELEKLDKLSRPYALTALLRAFVERAPTKAAVDAGAEDAGRVAPAADAALDPTKVPIALEGEGIPADNRLALNQAHKAQATGNAARARVLYEAVLARNPGDSEALAGLGDLARASGDWQGAIGYYKRVIAINPSYLPALIGLADAYWSTGNPGEARRLYQDIVDRFPESAYPGYVKQRAGAAAPPTPAPTPTPTPPQPPTSVSTPTASAAPPPPTTSTSTSAPGEDKTVP